jgi:hypothetical protein
MVTESFTLALLGATLVIEGHWWMLILLALAIAGVFKVIDGIRYLIDVVRVGHFF